MEIVAKRVLDSMSRAVTASLGLAVYPLDGREVDELMQRAQEALSAA